MQEARNFVFAEPVPDRKAMNVLPAIARLCARLRALGLPVMRLHSERARELVSAPITKFAEERGSYKTTVPGDGYNKEDATAQPVLGPVSPLKRAAARVCREAGARVTCNTLWRGVGIDSIHKSKGPLPGCSWRCVAMSAPCCASAKRAGIKGSLCSPLSVWQIMWGAPWASCQTKRDREA